MGRTLGLALLIALTAPAGVASAAAPALSGPSAWSVGADTVVTLRPGDRVLVDGLSGRLSVMGVEGSDLHLATERRGDQVVVRRDGDRVRISPAGRVGRRPMDVVLRVPRWAGIRVEAVNLDVDVTDVDGDVAIETITGDVHVERVGALLSVSTVDGGVDIREPRGPTRVSAHADDIVILGPGDAVEAVSLDGDITITGSSSGSVRAETQSGDIEFAGAIRPGGRYEFYLHSGDVRLVLPATLDARVRASTFHGDFQSDFPVVVREFTSGRAFDFTVGDGGAVIEVEVFDGEIRLSRAP